MQSIDELRKKIMEKVTLDNIVEAVIYKAQKEKIPKAEAFLQKVFFRLKTVSPGLFSNFIFDESGITPFSSELDSVLFRLETSTILSTLNPTYKNYIIINNPELLEASYKKLASQKAEVDKCAEVFSNMIKQQGS